MKAKCDQDKEENQASHDNNDSDKGAECIFRTAPARRIKVKSLHGTPPSSPDTKVKLLVTNFSHSPFLTYHPPYPYNGDTDPKKKYKAPSSSQ